MNKTLDKNFISKSNPDFIFIDDGMTYEQTKRAMNYVNKASKIIDPKNMNKLIDEAANEFIFNEVDSKGANILEIYNKEIDEKLVRRGKDFFSDIKEDEKKQTSFSQFIMYLVIFYKKLEKSYIQISYYNTPTFKRLRNKTKLDSNFSPITWFHCSVYLPKDVFVEIFINDDIILFWDYYGDFVDGIFKKAWNNKSKLHEYFTMLESLKSGEDKFNFCGPEHELFSFWKKEISKINNMKINRNSDFSILYQWITSAFSIGEDKKNITPDNIKKSQYYALSKDVANKKSNKSITEHTVEYKLEILEYMEKWCKDQKRHSSLEEMRQKIEKEAYAIYYNPNNPSVNKAIDKFLISDALSWLQNYNDPDKREFVFLMYIYFLQYHLKGLMTSLSKIERKNTPIYKKLINELTEKEILNLKLWFILFQKMSIADKFEIFDLRNYGLFWIKYIDFLTE